MSQKKKAAPLPDTLRKELRRAIAIYIYCDVVCKKEGMKEADQTKLMETLFFGMGGPDVISYMDIFLKAGGVFEFMFEQHKNEGKLKLKQMFARDPNAYMLGEQLKKPVLESVTQKGVEVVTGRYLYDWAKKGLAGIRKSLPFLLKYLNDKGGPKASGQEMEDIIKL